MKLDEEIRYFEDKGLEFFPGDKSGESKDRVGFRSGDILTRDMIRNYLGNIQERKKESPIQNSDLLRMALHYAAIVIYRSRISKSP